MTTFHVIETCIGGSSVRENGALIVPMFDSKVTLDHMPFAIATIILSSLCNFVSCYYAYHSSSSSHKRHQEWRSTDFLFWNIFWWQCTNTYILPMLVAFGVTRLLMTIFDIHTFLEWIVSIFYEYNAYENEQENERKEERTVSLFDFLMRRRFSLWRTIIICTVISYSILHTVQVALDPYIVRAAWFGRFGYLLDGVGLVSSLRFAMMRRKKEHDRLGLYCLGAFGGHALAILGTFTACVLGYSIQTILLLTSCLQNVCSTAALSILAKIRTKY